MVMLGFMARIYGQDLWLGFMVRIYGQDLWLRFMISSNQEFEKAQNQDLNLLYAVIAENLMSQSAIWKTFNFIESNEKNKK